MKWRSPTSTADRWAAMLTEVRETQHQHPGLAAELWEGDSSTAYSYRAQLVRGMVPGRRAAADVPLSVPVDGFVFTTRQVGQNRRALLAMHVGTQATLPWPEPACQ